MLLFSLFALVTICCRALRWCYLRLLRQTLHILQADGTRRALVHALTAELTLLRVDVCQVVVHGDSTKGTHLCTLAAADTSRLAGLHHHRTTVLRAARHIYRTVLRPLLAKLEQALRAGLDASTAGAALVGIHLHKARLRVDV